MSIPADLNQLIHAIYAGALEDSPWHDFLNRLIIHLEADIAVLMIVPGNQQSNKVLFNQVARSATTFVDLSEYWLNSDPFLAMTDNTPLRLDQLETNAAQLAAALPQSLQHLLALNISTTGNAELLLKLRLGRTADKADFNADQVALLTDLADHIKLALQWFDQNAIQKIERNAFADAINQFMLGTLILDRSGTIVGSNRVARDCIEEYKALSIKNGSLMIADPKANRQLYQALDGIALSDNGDDVISQTITIPLGHSLTLGLMVRPVRPDDALAYPVHAHAVVFISSSQGTRAISAATLKELFGLTDSESRVAAYLANGNTLTEAAEALSVSINTAKTHARNIYEKTGVNKQTKFIQLVSNSVARVS